MANQASSPLSIINILMVRIKYFETACLGGYQDSSIVYQFQSSKLFRIKTILKFMLPVIFLNLYYTSGRDLGRCSSRLHIGASAILAFY